MTGSTEPTPEQERFMQEWEAGKLRYSGQPVPRISRVKRDDYPHWHLPTWLSRMVDGVPVQVRRDGGAGPVSNAVTRGQRMVTDNGPHALLVEVTGLLGVWGLRRADGRAWVRDIEALPETVQIDVQDEPVVAWPVSESEVPGRKEEVSAPSHPPSHSEEWTLRTTNLEQGP